MPVISSFFGIYIRMYHDDHNPPHIHAEYQGNEALISIENGDLLVGRMPKKAMKIIAEWTKEHQNELMENWGKAVSFEPLDRIAGADND